MEIEILGQKAGHPKTSLVGEDMTHQGEEGIVASGPELGSCLGRACHSDCFCSWNGSNLIGLIWNSKQRLKYEEVT